MQEKFLIKGVQFMIDDDKIIHDADRYVFYKVEEEEGLHFDAITCLARPVEFSVVNRLYALNKEDVLNACEICNETDEVQVLSTGDYHLIINPLIERYTFFGKDEAYNLANQVIDQCIRLKVEKLRITQFCMMLNHFPYYDQIKGILNAFTERSDSTVKLVFFDIPDKNFIQLSTLFRSYTLE